MVRTLKSLLGAAPLALWPMAAAAGDASCVWNALPPDLRARKVAAYAQGGFNASVAVSPDIAEFRRATAQCRPGSTDSENDVLSQPILKAVDGHGLELGAAARLKTGALKDGLDALPARRRQALKKSLAALIAKETPQLSRTAEADLDRAARAAGWDGRSRSDPVFADFSMALFGRVIREANEPGF